MDILTLVVVPTIVEWPVQSVSQVRMTYSDIHEARKFAGLAAVA